MRVTQRLLITLLTFTDIYFLQRFYCKALVLMFCKLLVMLVFTIITLKHSNDPVLPHCLVLPLTH